MQEISWCPRVVSRTVMDVPVGCRARRCCAGCRCGCDLDDRGEDASDSVKAARNGIACPAMRGWKHLTEHKHNQSGPRWGIDRTGRSHAPQGCTHRARRTSKVDTARVRNMIDSLKKRWERKHTAFLGGYRQLDTAASRNINSTYCVRPEAHENPRTAASVVLVVNRKRKMPVSAVDTAIVNFLPPSDHRDWDPRVQSTTRQAIKDPGIPRTEMMV